MSPKYAHLSGPTRRAIIEILRDTKDDLPRTWSESGQVDEPGGMD
jgi:hypothetical protein